MPVACVLIVLALVGAGIYLRNHGIVYLGFTRAGWTVVRDDTLVMSERIRVLTVGGTYQSATYLDERWADPVFVYHRLFDHVFDGWPEGDGPRRIAVLGGGGYAIPKHFIAHHPEVARIDVVEIDPAIERIARRHFFLDRLEERFGAESSGRLHLHVCDALSWLETSDLTFDAIINDCFSALEPEETLMTAKAAQTLGQRLAPGGMYLTNVVSSLEGPDCYTLYSTIEALSTTFAHVWVYPCSQDRPMACDNNVVIASDAMHDFPGAWVWPTKGGNP